MNYQLKISDVPIFCQAKKMEVFQNELQNYLKR